MFHSLPLLLALVTAPAAAGPPAAADQPASDAARGANAPAPSEQNTAASDDNVEEVDVLEASDCPQLFGSDAMHEANQAYRKAHVHHLAAAASGAFQGIEIVHSVARWRAPARRQVVGMDMIDLDQVEDEAGGPAELIALVDVDEAAGDACPPGVYAIGADDALGRGVQVVSVERTGMVLEEGGALFWVPLEGAGKMPRFRMVWRSPYDVDVQQARGGGGKSSSVSAKAKARTRANREKRKKKRAKKKKKKRRKRR